MFLVDGPDEFTKRGIKPEIRIRRPYYRWTTDEPQPLRDAWYDFVSKRQRGFVGRVANQSDGYVIPRYAPPGLDLDPVAAEIRPDDAVETGAIKRHDHAKHFTDPALRSRHVEKEHGGIDRIGLHEHRRAAKYVFPPGPLVEQRYWHDHKEMNPERRTKHIEMRHKGVDRVGSHPHTYKVKSKDDGLAKRLDVHPDAVPLFEIADWVFFVIEGCLKADAILSQGEAVFSVPSVTLWDAKELQAFAARYLAGKMVVIVPDADWAQNDLVIAQAMLCRSFLRRLGLQAWVAAPPMEAGHKGIDDYLGPVELGGGGGTLDDLVVIGRELPAAFDEWVLAEGGNPRRLPGRWADGVIRDVDVLQNLMLHGTDDGTIRKSISTYARIMGVDKKRVSRAIESLLERPGLTSPKALWILEGSTATQRGAWKGRYYDRSLDWEDKPLLQLAKEFRPINSPPKRLGDFSPERDGEQQFITRDFAELARVVRARTARSRAMSHEDPN